MVVISQTDDSRTLACSHAILFEHVIRVYWRLFRIHIYVELVQSSRLSKMIHDSHDSHLA